MDLALLERYSNSEPRGSGRTTNGVMLALQTMESSGGVYYLVHSMSFGYHIQRVVFDFARLWNLDVYRTTPNFSYMINGGMFRVVSLRNYESITRGSNFPVVIDHYAEEIGKCVYCGRISNRTCNCLQEEMVIDHDPFIDLRNYVNPVHVANGFTCDDSWKEDGF